MNYFRTWNCRVCKHQQTSTDYPRVLICDVCVQPLVKHLCKIEAKADITDSWIDAKYFENKAVTYVELIFKRWHDA